MTFKRIFVNFKAFFIQFRSLSETVLRFRALSRRSYVLVSIVSSKIIQIDIFTLSCARIILSYNSTVIINHSSQII